MSQPCLASAYAGRELREALLCWVRTGGTCAFQRSRSGFHLHAHDVGASRVSHAENLRAGELGPDGWELGLSFGHSACSDKAGLFRRNGHEHGHLES